MEQGVEHIRLAVSVFDRIEDLENTLAALKSRGFLREQFCLTALESNLAAAASKTASEGIGADEFRALTMHTETWSGLTGGHCMVATSGSLLRKLQRGAIDYVAELMAELLGGAIGLIVCSDGAQQQVVATRILLRSSSHRVRTYDYTTSASAG